MLESENILLQRFSKTGDAEAFSEIVRRHAGLVYGASLRVLEDKNKAADAVQETFLQLLRNAENISGSIPAWLHRVATRKAIDAVRRDSARKKREARYAAENPCEASNWGDISLYVDEALGEVDDQTREILIQHFFEGQTTTQIAANREESQPTVSRRIRGGVDELRKKLHKRGLIVAAIALGGLLEQNAVQAAPALVLKELGKIAIVGGQAAAATGLGTTAAVSGAGAKTAASGLLAGVKVKIVTAAAVAAVGVGTAVTYHNVTTPVEVPARRPANALQAEPPGQGTQAVSLRRAETPGQNVDIFNGFLDEQPVPASGDDSEWADESFIAAVSQEEMPVITGRRSGGMGGGFGGAVRSRRRRSGPEEDPNSARGMGGIGGGFRGLREGAPNSNE